MTTDTEVRTGRYEVMLLAGQSAAAQLTSLLEHIQEVFSRANASVVSMKKWDDRRLAYEIDKQKRGVYFLAYIDCPVDQVAKIERDVQISEQLLRVMITRADHLTEEEIMTNDDRQALADEAKMRLDEAANDTGESASKVHLGAPTKTEVPAEAAPAEAAEAAEEAAPAAEPEAAAEADAGEEKPAEG